MNETPILVQNVSRSFDKMRAVDDLSLRIGPGHIYGFLGRNGSGKTTTMRLLAGLIRPDAGEVRVGGCDPFTMSAEQRQWFGYMPERNIDAGFVRVQRLWQLGRELYPAWDQGLVDGLVARFGLNIRQRLTSLSQGNQRLVSFIMAVAPRPKVLLLDEPAATLDVVARREILDEILTLVRERACSVLFSTHILGDVERVADEIGILAEGRLRVSESLDELKDSIRQVRFFNFSKGVSNEPIPGSFRVVKGQDDMTVTLRAAPAAIEGLARRWGCEQETRALNLEDIFIELSRHSSS